MSCFGYTLVVIPSKYDAEKIRTHLTRCKDKLPTIRNEKGKIKDFWFAKPQDLCELLVMYTDNIIICIITRDDLKHLNDCPHLRDSDTKPDGKALYHNISCDSNSITDVCLAIMTHKGVMRDMEEEYYDNNKICNDIIKELKKNGSNEDCRNKNYLVQEEILKLNEIMYKAIQISFTELTQRMIDVTKCIKETYKKIINEMD